MLRTLLLVLPFTVFSALFGFLVMIPVTWIVRDIRPIYAVARAVVRWLVRLAGIRVEASGCDPWLAPQPCLYVVNHASNLDPPILFARLPRMAIIAKAALFRWPLLGYAMERIGEFIPVDRGRPESRRQAMEAGSTRLRMGISLLIFPEGTRSPDGALLPFRPGPFTMAIETHAPIVPITISGTRLLMSKGKLGIRPGRVRVVFHAPVATQGLTQTDREELMERVRHTIASALDPAGPRPGAAEPGEVRTKSSHRL
jgi:1-acyl-sn-glycerol-3-phosphate acyltransferase